MNRSLIILLLGGFALRLYGDQGTVLVDNLDNSGVFNGAGNQPFNGISGDPVYSPVVTTNGLIFTTDPLGQAGNLGYSSSNSRMLGVDVSFELFGGPSPSQATNPVAGLTDASINGDVTDENWGQFAIAGTFFSVPGTTATALVYLHLQMWEGNAYPTFAAAQAAGDYVADSGVFVNPSGGGIAPPKDLSGMPDMLLIATPEPSTFTLSLLAACAFFLKRGH